ncbi:MAG: tRNA-intron lyase [Nitrososphaeria archaeon]|nr:tRNA-intron lyase [Aigarchaeota archaeon]MCX8187448.1 tRNA-intron lyase [Nitrososphaeria archaeon]
MSGEKVRAELIHGTIVVWDIESGRELYRSGFYGKPLGISKPKSLDFNAPLVLDIIEAVYLVEKDKLEVYEEKRKLSFEDLVRRAGQYYEKFEQKYLAYRDLRDRGFIVTPGIKFGSDFAVYRIGPGLEHAPFIVQVKSIDENISALEMIRSGRLATTVKKYFTIAIPDVNSQRVAYVLFEWWRA